MKKAEIKMRALCALAVSALCACGSGPALTLDEGTAGRRSSTAGAGGTSATGTAGIAQTTASGGVPGGNADASAAGATGGAGVTDGGADALAGARGTDAAEVGGIGGAGGSLTIATAGSCSQDGWCWSTPLPQGNPLYSISGSGASDVWAVGESGTIVHWDGKLWTQVPSGQHGPLRGVWAGGASDVWAVGDDAVIVHWNGTAWSRRPAVPFLGFHWRAVWGSGPDDVWIVGVDATSGQGGGAMLHWDGALWTTTFEETQSFDAIWGTGPNDVWAVGDAHGLFHWDGKTWTTVSTGLPQLGTAIWGSSSSDLWFGARSAALPSHWNGTMLDVDANMDADIDGMWGSGANDVWAVGDVDRDFFGDRGLILHWDGVSWQPMSSSGASHLFAVWGSRSDDVWAVGESGDIVHWNGRAWSAPAGPPHVSLFSVWGSGSDDVWAFGYDRVGLGALHWNGQTWAKTEVLDAAALGASSGDSTAPYNAWGSGRDDIWIAAVDNEPIAAIPGSATARSLFVHWDGHLWSLDSTLDANVAASMNVSALWGNGPKDVWAVGVAGDVNLTGVAVHWDGARWNPVTSLSATDLADPFLSVWSSGPKDVWIGGTKAVHHWDGVSWASLLTTQDGGGFLVAGSGPADVWAVWARGDQTTAASHWNGLAWQNAVVPPSVTSPNSVVTISPTNAWLRGEETMAHWNGTIWAVSDPGTNLFSSNLWWDGTEIWVAAMRGLIRHP